MGLTKEFSKGAVKENPVFTLLFGLTPLLAVSTSAAKGLSLGVITLAVLIASSLTYSLLRNLIPQTAKTAAAVIVIAGYVTIADIVTAAFFPDTYSEIGFFIKLISVNCLILNRTKIFAAAHTPLLSIADALGMGIGFIISLTLFSALREVLGEGAIFGFRLTAEESRTIVFFSMPSGALILLGLLLACFNKYKNAKQLTNKKENAADPGSGAAG